MQNISFQYPIIWLLVSLLVAIVFSLGLYYKSGIFTDKKKSLSLWLGILRFMSIGIIAILLLGPILQSTEEKSKKPVVVVAQDISESIGEWLNLTSNSDFDEQISSLSDRLSDKFDVDIITFGADTYPQMDSINYTDKTTDIDRTLEYVSDIYEGENLAASIIITDGIYNQGKNPLYSRYNHTSPVHAIALGDTTPQIDLAVHEVLYNQIGYLNDQTQIQIDIRATDSPNQRTLLTVRQRQGNSLVNIHEESLTITGNDFFTTKTVTLDLSQVGVNEYVISLSPLNNEKNRTNNNKTIYIDVLDARQNIVILANAPHPDLGALKQILTNNKNYEVSINYDIKINSISKADLVIFHNLPSQRQSITSIIKELDRRAIPRFLFVGSQTDLGKLNKIQSVIDIKGQPSVTNESQAMLDKDFVTFNISNQLINRLSQYPPVISPFGEYVFNQGQQTLLHQSVGGISTDFPLLSFVDYGGIKWGFFFGEGIWKWKYFDHIEDGHYEILSELIDKSMVYTSTKTDKRQFRVSTSNTIYQENDDIKLSAELYNSNYELINDPDAFITIINNNREEFAYTFTKSNNGYSLNAGKLSPGRYTYQANTTYAGEQYEDTGKFSVKKIEIEKSNLQANHNILYGITAKSGGTVFYPNQLSQLGDELIADESLKPMLFQNVLNRSVLDFKWLFGMLLLSLAAEWFLRRYFGRL